MVKNQKSSASSATRKKHAKKVATAAGEVAENPPVPKQKKPRGKEKARLKAEPRKKIYIPPVRPRAIQPDPLDTLGIAYSISSELHVVLRKLGKKDPVTKIHALEELQDDWILKAGQENDSQLLEEITTVLPVWLHHIPSLFLHPSRRIRLLSGGLHSLLLALPGIKAPLFTLIRDLEVERQEAVIGSWCLLAHDIENQVSLAVLPSWGENFGPGAGAAAEGVLLIREAAPALISFIRQTIFDPLGAYSVVNPIQPSVDTKPVKKGAKLTKPQPRIQAPLETPSTDEELSTERKARLRAGALSSVKYVLAARNLLQLSESSQEAIEETLSNSLLWTSLYCGEQPPTNDSECLGFEQPVVRRAAWGLLLSVLEERKGELDAFISTLSTSVLRSAWAEWDAVVRAGMWQPLLNFITEYPQCWELDARFLPDADGSDSENEGDFDLPPSVAYKEFLRFLELGCRGSPRQGYPALVIVLSTIPLSVTTSLPSESPLEDLFTSFWSALDSRAFGMTDKAQTFSAFAHAFVDCLLLFVKRLRSSTPSVVSSLVRNNSEADGTDSESGTILRNFVHKQTTRFVGETFQGRLRLDPPAATEHLSKIVTKLDEVEKDLSKTAWECISDSYIRSLQSPPQSIDIQHFTYLKHIQLSAAGALFESSVKSLIRLTFEIVIGNVSRSLDSPPENRTDRVKAGSTFEALLDVWGKDGVEDPESSINLHPFMKARLPQVVRCGPSLVSTYLGLLPEKPANTYWHQVLDIVSSFTTSEALDWLYAFNSANVPHCLQPSQDFEEFFKNTITTVLEDGKCNLERALSLLERPDRFVTESFVQSLFRSLSESIVPVIQQILRVHPAPSDDIERHLTFFQSTLFRYLGEESLWDVYRSLLPEIFLLGSLIDEGNEDAPSVSSKCLEIWSGFLTQSPESVLVSVKPNLCARLQFHVRNVDSCSRPTMVFKAASRLFGNMSFEVMDLVPSKETLDSMLSAFPTEPTDASMSMRSPLLPFSGLEDPPLTPEEKFDLDGYSSYARIISLLLDALSGDRIVAKAHPWTLRHFVALSIYAEEVADLPNRSSEVFDAKTVSPSNLQQLVHKVQQVTTYILSNIADGQSWHQKVTAACADTKVQYDVDEIGVFVVSLFRAAISNDNPRDARMLHTILQHVLSHTSKEEGELWMGLCRRIETKAPFVSMAVALSVAGSGSEPLRLDRYRNELAANAMGVRPAKINTEGLWILRRLVVTAPDPDSDVVFIPQARAVNFLKACQHWVTSDADIEEEVETRMTVLFFHLAPILQHVPGSHWDFIFDVIENNLENFAVEEPSTIVTLARSLQTILKVIDLTSTNRTLRANWEARNAKIFTLVRNIATAECGVQSGPLSTSRELLLTVTQNIPSSLIEIETLGKATHLLNDKSVEVQKMAYQLMQKGAKKRTEYIVIETGVSVPDSDSIKPELPPELIAFLQKSIDEEDPDAPPTFGYLLGWMCVFDLFVDASLKVKIAYINHLRDLEMITSHFLPAAFRMFDLYSGIANAPKLDIWGIEEYYVSFYEGGDPLSVVLLCAHLYYRALKTVPTLIRSWILECKDRKLSTTVTAYTSKYFSSVLTDAELERVATTNFGDEKMVVKVIATHREINTTYTIDESQIKMNLKIPEDWPLHFIEVRGVKKVGVKEDRWQSWISGVRQVVLTQANVVDGLELFKKNVSAHFENKTECAICYSLISAADGNLPSKPCQTCKNSFHASCLYEWFKSSHSSSCPLCRSNIIR